MSNDENDALILKSISEEKKALLLKNLGLIPQLPSIVENINDDDIYSTTEVAEFLKFTPQHVTRLCRQNKLNALQVSPGGSYRIVGKNIKDFLKNSYCRTNSIAKMFLDN
ncbi:hypothetical protein DP73_11820 [Desulfosporosinus sp. HMP52]|uniref:helix-turn-helix domain-containing protein n=1 Tax=Desulfosporosinus sp. HMP52 TaxID=1487923 RepID=UPI00051FAD5E|nr:helix-turn-helix domain-containing protein [Desulfosporosinus sp. HMP52]KGK88744.1 hypothetical protein DP73_11820 [Desulfosporosinus sp. HMP52]